MLTETKHISTPVEFKQGDEAGSLRAVFSVFDVVDRDGDILRKAAFEAANGQEVPLCWAHDWARPVGKGVIRVENDRAIFDGRFFLGATDGKNAYETAREMGGLQEFSWGFRVPEDGSKIIKQDGRPVREITKAEIFEVSCVLKGAGIGTHIESIKADSLTYADQADELVASLQAFAERSKAAAASRAKEGRPVGRTNRARIQAVLEAWDAMTEHMEDLRALLAESESPPEKADDPPDVYGLFLQFEQFRAGQLSRLLV